MTSLTQDIEDRFPMSQTHRRPVPVFVQILSTCLFGAFAIVATVLAFKAFWPAGVALAVVMGWRGGFVPGLSSGPTTEQILEKVAALSPEAESRRPSGNASFDSYRSDMLARLEDEQDQFDSFLGRLRDAKDQSEFDRFLDERAGDAQEKQHKSDAG